MTLRQLEYVLMVAKCGSLSKAAGNLFVSQPTLSETIRNLEDELGFPVFSRSHSGMSLSEEGAAFIRDAQKLFDEYNGLESRYGRNRKHIRYFSVSSTHYYFAAIAFARMTAEMDDPFYKVRLLDRAKNIVIADVADEISEVGLLSFTEENRSVTLRELKRQQLEYVVLKKMQPYAYISEDHPLASKEALTIEDLKPYPCARFYQGDDVPVLYGEEFYNVTDCSREIYVTDNFSITVCMRKTQCYSIGCGVVTGEPSVIGITARPIVNIPETTVIYIHRTKRNLSELAARFIQNCVQTLGPASPDAIG